MHKEGYFKGLKDFRIYYQTWLPMASRSTRDDTVPLIKLPALIMAGDDVPDGARSRTLFESLGSEDKTLKLYAGLRHEIFNEPEHPRVIGDMSVWLDRHL